MYSAADSLPPTLGAAVAECCQRQLTPQPAERVITGVTQAQPPQSFSHGSATTSVNHATPFVTFDAGVGARTRRTPELRTCTSIDGTRDLLRPPTRASGELGTEPIVPLARGPPSPPWASCSRNAISPAVRDRPSDRVLDTRKGRRRCWRMYAIRRRAADKLDLAMREEGWIHQ